MRTMSGSLSMCRPSIVSGSIFRSSSGNWESMSKLTSVDSEPVRSLGRLGGDSPLTGQKQDGKLEENKRGLAVEVISRQICISVGILSRRGKGKAPWLKLEKKSMAARRDETDVDKSGL